MNSSLIEIADLSFSWDKTAPSPLLNISQLEIKKGERFFLYGPSGSGKSTLLNLVGGVLSPDSGAIHILGQNLSKMSSTQRDRLRGDKMGFIFQVFNLIPYLSVIENVILPCQFSEYKRKNVEVSSQSLHGEAERLLQQLGLDINQIRHRKVSELSIGQQQRVAAARALLGKPELIIADEPTSSLDTDARENFIQLLFEECEKNQSTVLFVSHDMGLASLFDRKMSLKEGFTGEAHA